jgi:hypothetical protein
MSKSKCSIRVLSSLGESWTTRRGARRLVARGLATGDPESGCIHMIEADPRFDAEAVSHRRARLVIVARNRASCEYRNEVLGLPNFVRTGPPRQASHGKKAA